MISTSERHAEHLLAGRNTQQVGKEGLSSHFILDHLTLTNVLLTTNIVCKSKSGANPKKYFYMVEIYKLVLEHDKLLSKRKKIDLNLRI